MARAPIVFASGKHPIREIGGFGHSVYVRAHALAAHRAGFDPQVFCVGDCDAVEETAFGTVRQVRSIRPHRQNMMPIHGPLLARAIERYVEAVAPAGVLGLHGFGVWSYAAVSAARALRARGIAVATIGSSYTTYVDERRAMVDGIEAEQPAVQRLALYGDLLWSPVVQRYERRGYRDADLVTANYRSVLAMIQRRHGPQVNVRIGRYSSPLAFEPEPAPAWRREPGAPMVFVTVSGHFERKGMDVFIRAMQRIVDAGVRARAICVGGGRLLEKHRALVRALRLDDVVDVCGFVPDVEPYLARGDVFVIPSCSEQSGSLSMIEAMRAGLPIVASDCDGLPEDLTGPDAGITVEPGSVGALADAMAAVASDADLRARLAIGARASYEKRFSAGAFVDDLLLAYRQVGIVPDPTA